MREILFRGKRVDGDKWIEGSLWNNYGEVKILSALNAIGYEVIPETVGQYTGLTANGKKIFEGDIIKHNNNSDNGFDMGKVYWDETHSQWRRTSIGNFHDSSFTYVMSCSCEYEVIGNIYDNPELLKGDKDNG